VILDFLQEMSSEANAGVKLLLPVQGFKTLWAPDYQVENRTNCIGESNDKPPDKTLVVFIGFFSQKVNQHPDPKDE